MSCASKYVRDQVISTAPAKSLNTGDGEKKMAFETSGWLLANDD